MRRRKPALSAPSNVNERKHGTYRNRDLWKTYLMGDEEIHALRGCRIQIERGEYVAIMGPSGRANRR